MGKRKGSFRSDNRGMTLVELLCSVAIFVCLTAVIGSVLVVTAKTYRGGTTEASMQQEAQLAVNVIEGLIIDAGQSVNYCYIDDANVRQPVDSNSDIPTDDLDNNRVLEITNSTNNKVDIIYEVSANRLMYQKTEAGVTGSAYLLAENVTDFDANVANYDATHNVVLDLEMENDSRTFQAEYNVTSRNDDVVRASYTSTPWVDLGIDIHDIILEPNQTYDLPVQIAASSGVSQLFTCILNNDPATLSTATPNCAERKIEIAIGRNEWGNLPQHNLFLAVFSDATKADGSYMDWDNVQLFIRRVSGINVEMTQDNPALDKYAAGTKYTVSSSVTGTPFLGPKPGESDYISAYAVDWNYEFTIGGASATATDYFEFTEVAATNTDAAYVEIELKVEMPANSKLKVTGTARHPNGRDALNDKTNKSGIAYVDVAIEDSDSLIRPGGVPVYPFPDPLTDPSDILRGTDYTEFSQTGVTDSLKEEWMPDEKQHRFFWRFRVDNEDGTYGEWTEYRMTNEEGSAKKINRIETDCLRPDKAYQIEFIEGIYSNDQTTLYWPRDPELLSTVDGYVSGFEGMVEGWTTQPEVTIADYAVRYEVGKMQMLYGEYDASWQVVNLQTSLGTATTPLELQRVATGDSHPKRMYYGKLGHFQGDMYLCAEYSATGSTWQNVADLGMNIDNWAHKGDATFYYDNVQNATVGYYRMGYYIQNCQIRALGGTLFEPEYPVISTENISLYDFNTGEGVIYIHVN